MLVLAIDTSTAAVTAGLVELPADAGEPRLVDERVTVDARAHAELLAPQIRDVLSAVTAGAPSAIVCGTGPGPFTGLRVGMVTAAALGDGLGLPVYGVCSLDAVAAAQPAAAAGHTLLVATDARRREVYWALYRRAVRVLGPNVERPAELAERLPELGVTAAAGAGALLYADVLRLPLLPDTPYPTAAGLVAVAADALRRAEPPQPLVPLYLRRPDAAEPGPRKPVLSTPVGNS